MVKTQNSPFKFLDPYDKSDENEFFGRDAEVNRLYQLVCSTGCLLIYGPSGVGKTSLIQCGLANRFQLSNWQDLHIRRLHNINESLRKAISNELIDHIEDIDSLDTIQLLHHLYLDYFKPIYLVFDQLEELYILGDAEERNLFASTLKKIVGDTSIKCKVILVMREEFIARLSKLEAELPQLKQMRMRVEAIPDEILRDEVIPKTCQHFSIELNPEPRQVAESIVNQVKGRDATVNLPYLQLYLDRLWHMSVKSEGVDNENRDDRPVTFSEELVVRTGDVGHVLGSFLDSQQKKVLVELKKQYPGANLPNDLPKQVVNAFVTPEGTKLQRQGYQLRIAGVDPVIVQSAILLLVDARIIRQDEDQYGKTEHDIYELAHDALARHIHDHRSDSELDYIRTKNYIDQVFQLTERPGVPPRRYLNEDELASAHTHRARLKDELEPKIWQYVDQSKKAHEDELQRDLKEKLQKERKLKLIGFGVVGIVIVALIVTILLSRQLSDSKLKLNKDESSRLIQLLDDYETQKTVGGSANDIGELYDNPTLVRQIAVKAAGMVEKDTNERAKEWIQRLKKSKNDNFFYQLSVDTHLPSPITGFTEDGKLFAAINPDESLAASVKKPSIGLAVWSVGDAKDSWLAQPVNDLSPYTLVSVKGGAGKAVVTVLTANQLDVLAKLADAGLPDRRQPLKQFRLTKTRLLGFTGEKAIGPSDTLTALSIDGKSKQALLSFSDGRVYRWLPKNGTKRLQLLNLPSGRSEHIVKIILPYGARTVIRIKKNTNSTNEPGNTNELASAYLVERSDVDPSHRSASELVTIRELPNLALTAISASVSNSNPEFLLGARPGERSNVIHYARHDLTEVAILGHSHPICGTDFSPDGKLFSTTDAAGIMRVYSTSQQRDNLPIANLLPIEKASLNMPLDDTELVDALFESSDWSRLTQNLFKAEEHYHRQHSLADKFAAMLKKIGNPALLHQQDPVRVYRFWLRLLPNLNEEINPQVQSGYHELSESLKTYLQGLPPENYQRIVDTTGQNRYKQQASGIIELFAAWAAKNPSVISYKLLRTTTELVQMDIDTLTEKDRLNIQSIIDVACRPKKLLTDAMQMYQLHELVFQLHAKTKADKPYQDATDCLAQQLSSLSATAFKRIEGLDYLLSTKDRTGTWWSILAREYERRNHKPYSVNDHLILIYGSLAFYQTIEGNYDEAIKTARKGVQLKPDDKTIPTDWIKSNLALALLMVGQLEEAKAIYQAYEDKPYTSYRYRVSNILFRQAFLDDLVELEDSQKNNLSAEQKKRIKAIRQMLQSKQGNASLASK
ncbi:nSTAND1 domain-containing NTPase [Spirosoma pulveris]